VEHTLRTKLSWRSPGTRRACAQKPNWPHRLLGKTSVRNGCPLLSSYSQTTSIADPTRQRLTGASLGFQTRRAYRAGTIAGDTRQSPVQAVPAH
jgi:hypothetical protein